MTSSTDPVTTGNGTRAIALHVLLATADPKLRARVSSLLASSAPVSIEAVDDLAACAVAMHDRQFDVILADAVTPGFDDPMLLRMARDTQPSAIRIALLDAAPSDVASRRDAALAMVSHFAVTPDDLHDLGDRVRRAAARHLMLESPVVRAQIAQCQVLPASPRLYSQLAAVLAMDDAPLSAVADVVAQDPEISARVLQLTNSAYTGRRRPTSNLADAVAYVGAPTVRGLVLTMEVLRSFRRHQSPTVIRLAENVAMHGRTVADRALLVDPTNREGYTAGLLHDLGKLVLAANDHLAWDRVEMRVAAGETHVQAEQAVYGVSHDAIGAALLATWGLPEELVDAVGFHHQPAELGDELSLAGVVHIADALSYDDSTVRRLDIKWIERMGVLAELDRWRRDGESSLV